MKVFHAPTILQYRIVRFPGRVVKLMCMMLLRNKPLAYSVSLVLISIIAIIGYIYSGTSYLLAVKIPEGLRREEVAELLAVKLDWSRDEVTAFNTAYQSLGNNFEEGVYFPGTYLVSRGDGGRELAVQLIAKFNDRLDKLLPILLEKDISWPIAVNIAAIIQKEAAGKADMPIVSAVIWNRLNKGMRLEMDVTLQYAKGTTTDWWPKLRRGDTFAESTYNTYRNDGLPPMPIASPGMDALNAALNPAESPCLFYVHDNRRVIHCAETFEGHRRNIAKYLW